MSSTPTPIVRICELANVSAYANAGVTHIISIGDANVISPDIRPFKTDLSLHRFTFADISNRTDASPTLAIVARMIARFDAILRETPSPNILFHCMAGVSRSPAAAFLFLVRAGWSLDAAYAEVKRVRGDWVQPNVLMIHYADLVMDLKGQMLAYVCHASGRPAMIGQEWPTS